MAQGKLWDNFRRAGILRVLANPLTSLIANPVNLVRSLYSCRVLFEGRWPDYLSVSGSGSLLRFFYMTQASNLRRHGLRGTSDTMGGGALNMQTFWYQSVIGVSAFQSLGGVVVALIGMLSWLFSHLVWLDGGMSPAWVVLVLAVVAASNNFYGNLFTSQNYAALGWALIPLAIWALLNHHVWLAALIWTGISFLSITVFVAAALMSFCLAVAHHEPLQMLGVVPGVTKYLLDLYYTHRLAKSTTIWRSLRDMLGFIGGRRDVKYKRPIRLGSVLLFAAVLALFPIAVYHEQVYYGALDVRAFVALSTMPLIWLMINQTHLLRIADIQSILMVNLSVGTAVTIVSHNWIVLAALWITNSNAIISIVLFQFEAPPEVTGSRAPAVKPFDIAPVVARVEEFISAVPPNTRVLIANEDPGRDYNRLFDGYLVLYELLFFCADRRSIPVVPDFYAAMSADLGQFWGRGAQDVRRNADANDAQHVVVYQLEGGASIEWEAHGFDRVATLRWSELASVFGYMPMFESGWIEWHLLRRRPELLST